jgi:hypothetical protein
MSVYPYSRNRYATEHLDDNGVSYLDEDEPVRYSPEPDHRFHVAAEGDTWWGLAHLYFYGIQRACGLWWALCDYQPEPVIDPTIAIVPGRTVVIPSERVLRTKLFTAARRGDH